jgi:hypothetical protein
MCDEKKKKGCEKPEKLKGKPGECTPEQIKECHGDGKDHPCEPEKKCPGPEKRETTSEGECTSEQKKKCHGTEKGHSCKKHEKEE